MEFYATLGDPCAKRDILEQMFQAGMTGVRVNLARRPQGWTGGCPPDSGPPGP